MRSPVRAVAHGVVLVAVAVLCFATVASGSFDVVTLRASAPAGPTPAEDPQDDAPVVDVAAGEDDPDGAADDEEAPADGDDAEGSGGSDAEGEEPAATVDAACRDAEVAWGAAAKAQMNLSVEHPRDLVTGFTTARDELAGAEPPAAIAQDWAVVATYLTMLADAVEAAGPDDAGELARSIDRVGRKIDASALTTSSQRVTEFFHGGCTA